MLTKESIKEHRILIKNLHVFFLFLVAATLPLPMIHFNSIIIVISFSLSLVYFLFFERKKIWHSPYLLLFVGLYFMHYIGFVNSISIKPVLFDVEQKLAFLALPLIFAMGPTLNRRQSGLVMLCFVGATLVICLLSFREGFHWSYSEPKLRAYTPIRHPYLGMYCVICVFLCLHMVSFDINRKGKLIYFVIVSFFVFFLGGLFAKMAIVSFFILMFLYLLGLFLQRKKYKWVVAFVVLLLTTTSYLAFVNETTKTILKKAVSLEHFSWSEYNPAVVNSLNLRFVYWSCSTEVLSKGNNWFFGVGTGEVQQLLEDCYVELGVHPLLVEQHHDPHNQYFLTWLSLGFIPLALFVFHFLFLLYRYVKDKNLIAFIFTFGVMLFCATESIMENQKGIVFYALFQSLFMFTPPHSLKKNDNILAAKVASDGN